MAGRTYLGPADFFEHDGKTYRQGESIPMSDAQARHMETFGHQFSDTDQDVGIRGFVAPAVDVVDAPRDDRGAPVEDVKFAHKQSKAE